MYAVIKAGGHQYKVQKGDLLTVDFINGQAGDKVTFDNVLMLGGDKLVVGKPTVQGATVEAVIKEQSHNDKLIIFKYRRRKNYKKRGGHTQAVTVVEVGKISG